ncbi:MAG TPA: hypothetical protein DEP72_05730 [Clostridiales bacterium]|nr:hypothetical protein [Clostridiales bacterium]
MIICQLVKLDPENTILEEVGELAKAIRKGLPNASVDEKKIKNYDTIESEVADVLIVLLSVCNSLNIDIYSALIEKEKENVTRVWKLYK